MGESPKAILPGRAPILRVRGGPRGRVGLCEPVTATGTSGAGIGHDLRGLWLCRLRCLGAEGWEKS
jgi:hypothetical protein